MQYCRHSFVHAFLFATVGACLLTAWHPSVASAQQQRFGSSIQRNAARFIEPPRSLSQQIREAENAIGEERYSDAILILGDLLERNDAAAEDPSIAGQDFFLGIEDRQGQRLELSLLHHCRNLLGQLPDAAMEIYELRYGALAKQGLEQATATRDWKKLRDVRQKYFHTVAGYQASFLLAQRSLYRGHPLAASMLLDDVVMSRYAVKQLGQPVIALHAVACRLGERSLPRELANQDVTLSVGGSESEKVQDWRQWIDEHYQFPKHDSLATATDYELLGGGLSRNENTDGQMPLTTPRWMLVTTATPLDEDALRETSEELAASGQLVPPSWTPLLVGDQLLMRTTERLRGVDHRTGKRVWQYPWFDPEEAPEDPIGALSTDVGMNEAGERLARTVFHDIPYGQITSDGERVFLLDDLSPSQHVTINPLIGVQGTQPIESGRNTLVALDLATEGKILWRLGKNGTVESELNEAFFLSPPISIEDELYTLVELSGDILLTCLDPATGNLLWKQQLIAVEGAAIGLDPQRRISGSLITYHEGVLICPTGTGATVAFNLVDRTLRWANSYERRIGAPVIFGARRTSPQSEYSQRWHSTMAIAKGNSVLVTPATTDNLFGYSVVDGKLLFSKVRQDAFFVAGIRDDQFLVVGPRQVTSYSLETGRLVWQSPTKMLSAGDQIVGRGVFGEGFYIVPTSSNELIKISMANGEVEQRLQTTYPLGNLVAIDGEIISQGPTMIAVAFGQKTLGPRVERLLEEDPNNIDALVQKALLLAEQGDRGEALAILQTARQIDPDSDDVLLLSIALMLKELRENPNPPAELEADLERIVDTPTQRLEFLALRLEASLRHKDVTSAAKRLLELSATAVKLGPGSENDSVVLREPTRHCDLDSWLSARAYDLMKLARESESLPELQSIVEDDLKRRSFGSAQELLATTQHLRPLGEKSLVRSAVDRLTDEENDFAAERLLLGPNRVSEVFQSRQGDDSESPQIANEDKLRLAKIYERAKMFTDALGLLNSISKSDAGASEEVGEMIRRIEPERSTLPVIDVTQAVTMNWQQINSSGIPTTAPTQFIVRPSIEGGQSFDGWNIVNLPNIVRLQTPLGQLIPIPTDEPRSVRNSDRTASISGGLMISERPGRISAINLAQMKGGRRSEALVWTRDFGSTASNYKRQSRPTAFGDTTYSYPTNSAAANVISELRIGPTLGDRLLVLNSGDLQSIDLRTNEMMWRNSDAPTIGHMVVNEGTIAVVSQMKGVVSEITTFNLFDGRNLSESAWEHGEIWTTSGNHVLAYETNDEQSAATVRLINPFTNEIVLETEAKIKQPLVQGKGAGAGRIIQDRFMVLFDSTGRLLVWDLTAGTQICEHTTKPFEQLQSMHAMWMNGRLIVFAANMITQGRGDMRTQQGDFHQPAHRIMSIDLNSGDLQWERNLADPWGITIHQPFNSPVIFLSRSQTAYTVNRSVPKIDLAMISLNDGKTIHAEFEKEVQPRSNGLTTMVTLQPEFNIIRVQIDGEIITYQFEGPVTSTEASDPSAESATDVIGE
ncbi:PQQ-binding-like beta-propeller repeat protein [Rhodopirellula sp. MGV]|uniref:outer membrane protein assembly factor BamB family protein n=1 Tax=Rhodopirellula sp. MGV TaxID=2023130 RepID=UPI000B96C7C5|nr:PQQ-binding-like beta-propeller repeat protein [Rhodopirellula sp. MGV]OYP29887.1 hypothetical protein CGZ80_24165 [Rhodopirellula sp. MGV]PNY33769.1 hypothetical protein C2E31_27140 [Rhodopirellula baltica]